MVRFLYLSVGPTHLLRLRQEPGFDIAALLHDHKQGSASFHPKMHGDDKGGGILEARRVGTAFEQYQMYKVARAGILS